MPIVRSLVRHGGDGALLVLPRVVTARLGWKVGDPIVIEVEGDALRLTKFADWQSEQGHARTA